MSNNPAEKPKGAESSLDDQWGEALSEQGKVKPEAAEKPAGSVRPIREGVEAAAKPANFAQIKGSPGSSSGNIEMILDIPVTISVELGRTRMVVKDILNLGQGAVVELEKLAGEPMEIMINGRLIARGEAVVVNEKFAIKLTDIVSPAERVSRLK